MKTLEQSTFAERKLALDRAQSYILRIRNTAKKQYAGAYLGWLCGLLEHEPEHKQLSFMAAQAVRLHIHACGIPVPESGTY